MSMRLLNDELLIRCSSRRFVGFVAAKMIIILMMSFSCEITCKSFVLFCELKNRVL